jgi:ketosteroid isomerase-like protein
MSYSKNINLILEVLKNEVDGDVDAALQKLSPNYSMTWVYETKEGGLFPTTSNDVKQELGEVYIIKGRQYDIRNITESKNVVMVEMIEIYPDPDTNQIYRTPQVIVLEIKDGKIYKGRHYTDPKLSYRELTVEDIENKALKGTGTKILINEKGLNIL